MAFDPKHLPESITTASRELAATTLNYIECISDSTQEDMEILEDTLEYVQAQLEAVRIGLELHELSS